MRCIKCDQPVPALDGPCPHCHFVGDPALVQELAHIRWLLGEIDRWTEPAARDRQRLQQHYTARQREIEIKLGLRLPPFDEEQARQAWPGLLHRRALLQRLDQWLAGGLVDPAAAGALAEETGRQVKELQERLEGRTPPIYLETDDRRLALLDFILQAADELGRRHGFTSPQAEDKVRAPLLAERAKLVAQPEAQAAQPADQGAPVQAEAAKAPRPEAPRPAPRPALPLRERLWRTLLSERTLQAMLFLGIFLLLAAAISFAVWGWQDFSAPLRVAIPGAFTALFFTLGWYVRRQTRMYRSGIALTAVAALLIPVDAYTIYANYHFAPEQGPAFWLCTSLACLAAYTITTLLTQSALFSYLVGAAAGSATLALVTVGYQETGLSLDWRTAALAALAAILMLAAEALSRRARGTVWHILAEPFRHLALVTAGVVMPLSLGLRYTGRATYDTLHDAMTINWWLGGFLFAWGAIRYRSRSLGLLAALSLPVATYMAQAALFARAHVNLAWHAPGLALLVPLYFAAGHRLLAHKDDPVLYGHGRTATGWGVALTVVAAIWSLTDLSGSAAAASSHWLLAGATVLAALLWQRPAVLYAASFFSFTTFTFVMTELNLPFSQLGTGWASLAIAHVVLALNVGKGKQAEVAPVRARFAASLVTGGFVIAALALLPPLLPYNGRSLAYVLGNWLGLAAWAAWLAHQGRPGFVARSAWARSIFDWLAAVPLPAWIWLLFANRGPLDASLPLVLAGLAWAMVAFSWRLGRTAGACRWPWYLTGLLTSVAAPIAALAIAPGGFAPAVCLLAAGLLYTVDAVINRQSLGLGPGGVVIAWGYTLLLDRLHLGFDALSLAQAALVAACFLAGLWAERRRLPTLTHPFLRPWYAAAHLLALVVLLRIYSRPWGALVFGAAWTNEMQLWAGGSQLLLGAVYILYAWGTYAEAWAYVAAWLLAAGGGFISLIYSSGRGSLAARVALVAAAFVLAERGLYRWRQRPGISRAQARIRLAWWLYRRPLLATGWLASAAAIGLALIRNLILLGGGRTQQIWAAGALLLVSGFYALSARLFHRARFVWLAALLLFAPWTILTHLGWLVTTRPTTPGFAISWLALAWLLYLSGLALERVAPEAYVRPLKAVAYGLLPFSLLWGVADVDTSRFTFGLAAGLCGLAALLAHRRLKKAVDLAAPGPAWSARFLYPALGLLPAWCVYLMAWLAPAARHEHYGLMLLAFGALGLAAGQGLARLAPRREVAGGYALPAYLTGYVAAIIGTLLVAHDQPLLAAVLVYDALLLVASAWLFRYPLWVYPAAALLPLSLLLTLDHAGVPVSRQGWWLIGLAAVYLAVAWGLRRLRLAAYGTAALVAGFALIALGLPPSSQDRTGALWGYSAATLLYACTAFWLQQPLLLSAACALAVVPYAVGLDMSALHRQYYGLALFPGALLALAGGWWLDARLRGQPEFPWDRPARWPAALAGRLLGWWALPPYLLGFGLAAASPFFTASSAGLAALNCLLLALLCGWAIYRFRLRIWLLAAALAMHLAAVCFLQELGWWCCPPYAWLRFLPVTWLAALAGLAIERRRGEGSPIHLRRCLAGWSRPLYALALLDVILAQAWSLGQTDAGAAVTLAHALLIAVLASSWASRWLPYLSAALGTVALAQWLASLGWPVADWAIPLARLALGYGLAGYALAFFRERREQGAPAWLAIWEWPLQRAGAGLSLGVLALTAWVGVDLVGWTIRAMLGLPFRSIVDLATVQRAVGVLALLGLLYVAAAFTHRRPRLGYLAIGMLLVAWALHAFYVQQWDAATQVQWYAIPGGLYLLGVSYLEWERGNKALARWLDYAGVLLMMGSLFWQTLLFGWRYALLLGAEGFNAFWWGSARRLRRFLYAGMMGVVLATAAQLINSLRSVNQWIVFGVLGLLVVIAATLVERKLEDIKAWRHELDTWE